MESLPECQNLGLSGVERCQLECIFICFSTAVAKEERVVVVAADPAEFRSKFLLQTVLYGIRIESELVLLV